MLASVSHFSADSADLEQGRRICISNKSPAAAGPGTKDHCPGLSSLVTKRHQLDSVLALPLISCDLEEDISKADQSFKIQ